MSQTPRDPSKGETYVDYWEWPEPPTCGECGRLLREHWRGRPCLHAEETGAAMICGTCHEPKPFYCWLNGKMECLDCHCPGCIGEPPRYRPARDIRLESKNAN